MDSPSERKNNNIEKEKIAQGKKQLPTQRIEWAPLQDNPSGIGSYAAFQQPVSRPAALEKALQIQHSSPQPVSTETVKEPAPSTISIPLQNVEEVVPQRTLPQYTEPVLTLVRKDVQEVSLERDRAATSPPIASASLFTQEKVQEISVEVPFDVTSPAASLPDVEVEVNIDGDGSDTAQIEGSVDACKEDDAAVDGEPSLFQHAANNIADEAEVNLSFPVPPVQQHVSKNIQDGLDLWAGIREYDQQMADEGFTQVLTKAQKQTRKKQVLGTSYQTRTKGALPSSK